MQFRNLCSDPLLGHHFLFAHMSKAWRAIHERPAGNFWSISCDFFYFLDRGRQVYMGKKIKCWKCPWRATFGPRLRGVAGHLPRHRGPFLARGPGVKNHCTSLSMSVKLIKSSYSRCPKKLVAPCTTPNGQSCQPSIQVSDLPKP